MQPRRRKIEAFGPMSSKGEAASAAGSSLEFSPLSTGQPPHALCYNVAQWTAVQATAPAGAVARVLQPRTSRSCLMQFVSADEKVALEKKREELYRAQIDVQER